jgi:hypothetical protein
MKLINDDSKKKKNQNALYFMDYTFQKLNLT